MLFVWKCLPVPATSNIFINCVDSSPGRQYFPWSRQTTIQQRHSTEPVANEVIRCENSSTAFSLLLLFVVKYQSSTRKQILTSWQDTQT